MRLTATGPKGQLHSLSHDSTILKNNPLADPYQRDILVYTPPGYSEQEEYSLFMVLPGYMSTGSSYVGFKPFGMNMPQRLDYLINSEQMGKVVAVFPDCFTAYGGNQFINSSATGQYMDYVLAEVIPCVEQHFSVNRRPSTRAVLGKSSGGYGAMMHGLLQAEHWGAIACHSGDAYFEYAYLADMPELLSELLKYDGQVNAFLQAVWSKEKLYKNEAMALMIIGMAAHYDPDPDTSLGFHLPIDVTTGEINWDRWQKWLAFDPVRLVEAHAKNLRQLTGIFIDCGNKDQFNLLWGARILHKKLNYLNINHEYQEFSDNHSDVNYRMNISLPYLYNCLYTS